MVRFRSLLVVLCCLLVVSGLTLATPVARGAGRTVNGDPSDWTGVASTTIHTDAEDDSADEWIYTGAAGDARTDPAGTDETNADLTEVRLTTDGTYLYFLFRLADITDVNKVHIAVGIDTNQQGDVGSAGQNFLGDDSGLTYNDRPFVRPERQLAFHAAGGGTQAVEWFAGGSWYGIGGSEIAISTANDVVEAQVPLNDLNGLNANSDFIMTVATFQNQTTWNNDGDSTANFGVTDAIDVMGIPGQMGNAFGRDLNDANVFFGWWIQLQGATDAPTAVVWDRLYHSQCDLLLAAGCTGGDHPSEQVVPLEEDGHQEQENAITFLSAERGTDNGAAIPGRQTDVYVYDDEPTDLYLLALQGDVTDGAADPRILYYGSGATVDMGAVGVYTGTWNGISETTYDIFKGTVPSQPIGDVYYSFLTSDEGGDRSLCRTGSVTEGTNSFKTRNLLGQWIGALGCANADYAYSVVDDDSSGPTITNVVYDGAQVCATVSDTVTNSGDGDSGISSVLVRYAGTAGGVTGGGGSTVTLTNGGGNLYCGAVSFSDPTYYRVEATNNDFDNGALADGDTSQSSLACDGASCTAPTPGDNDVRWSEVLHNTRATQYRSPFGAVATGSEITLTLRVANADLSGVQFQLYNTPTGDKSYAMTPVAESPIDPTYDFYRVVIPAADTASARILYYKFVLTDGTDSDWYIDNYSHNSYDHEDRYENGTGMMVDDGGTGQYFGNSFNITVYDSSLDDPDAIAEWTQNAVMYQILPDRFRNGDASNDDAAPYPDVYGNPATLHSTWNEAPEDARVTNQWSRDFFGGDLQGIIEKLDYLQDLGVTAIYLNPVFASPSNHGYDTTDYLQINPRFGDNALFQTLATQAEARGIKIVLDGVFNHTGSDSRYFDRYQRYDVNGNPSLGNDGSGGCESASSPYGAFYTFFPADDGPCFNNQTYNSWWGYDTLPLLNENTAVKDFVFDVDNDGDNGTSAALAVIQQWYSLGADGWRFDVADEISHQFWTDFRAQVKDNDGLNGPLWSEVWFEATPWLFGDQLDATMNYRYRKAVLGFLIDSTWTDNDNNGDQTMWQLSPSEFDYVLNSIREDYPKPSWYAMMNLMDSHDTNRALFVLSQRSDDLPEAIAKMRMMAALQFTYPGVPTIYYGDEVGLGAPYSGPGTWGAGRTANSITQDDPYNRHPYPWTDESGSGNLPAGLPNTSLLETYQTLGLARNTQDVLRTGDVVTLLADDTNNVYAYARIDGNGEPDCALAVFNRSSVERDVTLTNLPTQCQGNFRDILDNDAPYSTNGAGRAVAGLPVGSLTLNDLPALRSAVLVPAGTTGVQMGGFTATEDDGEVLLRWETVSEVDNQGFHLYRAPSASGPGIRVNDALIASQAPGSGEGFDYEWVDAEVRAGETYFYWLESVAQDGSTARFGPASVTVSAPTAIAVNTLGTPAPSSRPLVVALAGLAGVAALGLGLRRRRRR